MTSSAMASSLSGTVRPSALAVLRLIASANFILRRKSDQLSALIDEESTSGDNDGISTLLEKRRKSCVNLGWRGGMYDNKAAAERMRGVRDWSELRSEFRVLRIRQKGDDGRCRNHLMQHRQPLCGRRDSEPTDAGDIAARPIEARYQAGLDRVLAAGGDNWYRLGRRLGCE